MKTKHTKKISHSKRCWKNDASQQQRVHWLWWIRCRAPAIHYPPRWWNYTLFCIRNWKWEVKKNWNWKQKQNLNGKSINQVSIFIFRVQKCINLKICAISQVFFEMHQEKEFHQQTKKLHNKWNRESVHM